MGQFHARLQMLTSFDKYTELIAPLKTSSDKKILDTINKVIHATTLAVAFPLAAPTPGNSSYGKCERSIANPDHVNPIGLANKLQCTGYVKGQIKPLARRRK